MRSQFSKTVLKHLIDRDMTQAELAEACGWNPVFLSKIITGHRAPTPDVTCKIIEVLGLGGQDRSTLAMLAAFAKGYPIW